MFRYQYLKVLTSNQLMLKFCQGRQSKRFCFKTGGKHVVQSCSSNAVR